MPKNLIVIYQIFIYHEILRTNSISKYFNT